MESAFQLTVSKFAEAFCLFDLTINLGKSGVLLQLSPPTTICHPSISIKETDQKSVEEFKYCRSIISNNDHLDKVINIRICKASQALGRLWAHVLSPINIQESMKLKVYKTVVLTSHVCETWTVYKRHIKLLEHFHMWNLFSILVSKWQDRITNPEVLDCRETTSTDPESPIQADNDRIPKQWWDL